jgi:hypothetical protein
MTRLFALIRTFMWSGSCSRPKLHLWTENLCMFHDDVLCAHCSAWLVVSSLLSSLHLPSCVHSPDFLNDPFPIRIVNIMQIDCRINMAWHHLHSITNLQWPRIRSVLPCETTVLITQHSVLVPWCLTLREPTVRRQALQSCVDRNNPCVDMTVDNMVRLLEYIVPIAFR